MIEEDTALTDEEQEETTAELLIDVLQLVDQIVDD